MRSNRNLAPTKRSIAAVVETFLFLVLLPWTLPSAIAQTSTESPQATVNEPQFSPEEIEFFEQKIRPVLVTHCTECHSNSAAKQNRLKGGLRVDSRAGLLRGGDSGPSVVPNQVEESLLIAALRYESIQMPPKGKLPENVIADFVTWISRGAADPRTENSSAESTRRLDVLEGRRHWSYRPVEATTIPAAVTNEAARAGSPIDAFVLDRLKPANLKLSSEADRATLVRRVYLDLIGLPPQPEEIDEQLADDRPDAFERLVDRLLASSHFGVRWGRRWLSVVRFGESLTLRGFVLPESWRYRDYVINSFNEDRPFDRFIVEQIAGDLLPAESLADRQRQCIATTFLTLGNWNLEEQDKQQLRMDVVDEQLEAIGKGFLAQTIGCARCHDHKFDPIPTNDYYALAGILTNVKTLEDANVSKWLEFPLPLEPELESELVAHESAIDAIQLKIKAAQETQKQAANKSAGIVKTTSESASERKPNSTTPSAETTNHKEAAQLAAELQTLKQQLKRIQSTGPRRPRYMSVREEPTISDIRVHIRGSVHNLGKPVPRGFLQVTGDFDSLPTNQSGRKELGEWIANRKNPLTARVMANRIWYWLFGAGLSRTPDNFGTTGDPPSHPELLDHLAVRLIEREWTLKSLIREIVLSQTYRQSSRETADSKTGDPENRWLSHQNRRRLDAECLLDMILTVSDRCDDQLNGSMIKVDLAEDYGYVHRSNRRAAYWPVFRNSLPEIFEAFDFADPSLPSGSRNVSTVAPQSLFFLNNPWMIAQSQFAAERLLNETQLDDAARIGRAFRLVVGRPPNENELRIGLANLPTETNRQDGLSALIQALFASIDFRYVE